MLKIYGTLPETPDLAEAIYTAADVLGMSECYAHDGRYHFPLGAGRSIAVSSDSAYRIRVESCRLCRPESTLWVLSHSLDRLAAIVRRMGQVAEPA
jgi:hypothetical protein